MHVSVECFDPSFRKIKVYVRRIFQDLQASKSPPKNGGRTPASLGGGNGNSNIVFMFILKVGGRFENLMSIFFTDGLVKNHQPTKV